MVLNKNSEPLYEIASNAGENAEIVNEDTLEINLKNGDNFAG